MKSKPILVASLLLVASCAGMRETPAETQARLAQGCTEAGFAEGSDAYRLCLLMRETNDRLTDVERRLAFVEQDTRLLPSRGFYPGW